MTGSTARAGGSTAGAVLLAWLIVVGYVVVIPVAAGWPWTHWSAALGVVVLASLYTAVRLAMLVLGTAPLAHGLSLGFGYAFLGVAPIAQLTRDRFPWGGSYPDDTLLAAALLGLASIVAIDLAAALIRRRGRAPATPAPDPVRATPDPIDARWLVLLAALGSALLAISIIGPDVLVANRQLVSAALCPAAGGYASGRGSGDLATCGMLTSLIRVPPIFAFVIAAAALRSRRRGALPAMLLAAAALAVTSSPFGTPRAWMAVVAIGSLAPWLVDAVRLRRVVLAAMPLAILLVFPASDFARTSSWTVTFDPGRNLVEKADFDVYQQLANGVEYLDGHQPQYGRQVASAVLFFVPRSAWPDKSIPTGDLVSWEEGYTFTNLSAPPALEGWVDLGLPGAILMSLVVGAAAGALDRRSTDPRSPLAARSLWVIEIGFLLYVLRGALLPAATYLGPILLVHAAIAAWARLRAGSRDRAAVPARAAGGYAAGRAIPVPDGTAPGR